MVHTFFLKRARKIVRRVAKTRVARTIARRSVIGRTVARATRTTAGRRAGRFLTFLEAPALPTARFLGRGFRAAGRFVSTRRGRVAVGAGAAILASPTLTRKAVAALKKDPSLVLLATPLAAIPIGRGIGRAVQRFGDAPPGKKLAAVATGVGAAAVLAGGALAVTKLLKKGKAVTPGLGTPAALAGGAVVGAIPTAPSAAAKKAKIGEPTSLPTPMAAPVNVTTKIIVQNL